MTSESPSHIIIPPESLYQPLGDEAVVLSVATEHYYGLNETAKRIWELLVEFGDLETVVTRMREEFEVDDGTLRNDVARLIDELREAQLVRIEG
ncbi:MAG: PqqD family protein [Methylocystis silviterrae]|uniref:PqqD family protein n=1 Tax=Methylocystis silviterrae TaxID=2743612 RepID=UPI003C76F251